MGVTEGLNFFFFRKKRRIYWLTFRVVKKHSICQSLTIKFKLDLMIPKDARIYQYTTIVYITK